MLWNSSSLPPAISDMFPHKHSVGKFPFPIPPIPGWGPDTNPWDDYLYPPLNPKPRELTHHRGESSHRVFLWILPVFFSVFHLEHMSAGKPKVRLTSDSPAINGSCITFTAKLEYPPCQKEDANGELVWDEHCPDGMELEASGAAKKPGQAKHQKTPLHHLTQPTTQQH